MTNSIALEEIRQLLPSKHVKVGCHDISKGIVLEVVEEHSWKHHSHIRGSYPDNEKIEERFEAGPIYSFYCEDSYVDVRYGTTIVGGRVAREPNSRAYRFPTPIEFNEARVLDPLRVVLPLASIRMKNYCRYWIDSIAKLYVYQRSSQLRSRIGVGPADVVAPKLKLPFQRQAADLLKQHTSIWIQKKMRLVRGRTMNATGVVSNGQHVGKIVCDFSDYLNSIIPALTPPHSASSERLYISRNDAQMRRVLNEEEIVPALRDLGFEIIRPGEMPLVTQIERFRRAKIILAPHGAALTNILFCRPHVTLIEIFPRGGVHGSMFMRIASQRNLAYYFVVGESVANSKSADNPNNADLVLDPASFISFVRQVIDVDSRLPASQVAGR